MTMNPANVRLSREKERERGEGERGGGRETYFDVAPRRAIASGAISAASTRSDAARRAELLKRPRRGENGHSKFLRESRPEKLHLVDKLQFNFDVICAEHRENATYKSRIY